MSADEPGGTRGVEPVGGDSGGGDPRDLTPIDVLLHQGPPEAQAELWHRAANEPAAMLAMAETVLLVQQLRTLQTEAGPNFATKLAAVLERARRRVPPPTSRWQGWPFGVAAAAGLFAGLCLWDPLRVPAGASLVVAQSERSPASSPAAPPVVADRRDAAWLADLETMRKRLGMEPSPHLREALEAGVGKTCDSLGGWLDPRNRLMLMHLEHELRGQAAVRQEALRCQGGLGAVDGRVQQLATAIADQMLAGVAAGACKVDAVALGLRALIAAGPGAATRAHAVEFGSRWLADRLPATAATELVQGLAALVEVAAVTGEHQDVVAAQGERLVALVLQVDGDNWRRWLPELLGPKVRASVLAEANRVLTRLPAFRVDAGRCAIVRQLLLAPLRDRRDAGEDSPELVAAMLYGSADLLAEGERDRLELQLRRWQPAHLVGDFTTVQQMAWALEPGRRGFTHLQADLRQLAVIEDPQVLGKRAAFCLCLATDYAAFPGGLLPKPGARS